MWIRLTWEIDFLDHIIFLSAELTLSDSPKKSVLSVFVLCYCRKKIPCLSLELMPSKRVSGARSPARPWHHNTCWRILPRWGRDKWIEGGEERHNRWRGQFDPILMFQDNEVFFPTFMFSWLTAAFNDTWALIWACLLPSSGVSWTCWRQSLGVAFFPWAAGGVAGRVPGEGGDPWERPYLRYSCAL